LVLVVILVLYAIAIGTTLTQARQLAKMDEQQRKQNPVQPRHEANPR
jgi:hypothetical protein